jgi:hypothetical protein
MNIERFNMYIKYGINQLIADWIIVSQSVFAVETEKYRPIYLNLMINKN